MQVVAGHGRLQACQLLGITEVPTISLEHLIEAQARAFMIADNRLTENAAWDDRLLAEQLKELSDLDLDFSLEATGFEMGEIDVLVENLAPATEGEDDPADEVPEPTVGIEVSKAGDLWQLGRHKVYCGNSLNDPTYAALMGDAKAAMVFTDPPYNVRIDGHATGLGTIQHKDFKMASGEMSPAAFTDFLSRVCTLLASHSGDGSIHFVCMD
jgi:hypothetical protein